MSQPRIRPSTTSPTWSGFHRVAAKNRCARLWRQTPLAPEAVSIPHTVRRAGAAIRPVTNVMNVSYPRAEKHGRNRSHSWVSDPGGMMNRGIVAHA
jgi:hypothetical protein